MIKGKKYGCLLGVCCILCMVGTACGKTNVTPDTEIGSTESIEAIATSEGTTEMVTPVEHEGYRDLEVEFTDPCKSVANPGTRENFSFEVDGKKYVFTETETLWLYNQSIINECETQFLLSVRGNKVVLAIPEEEELEALNFADYDAVYEDDVVTIYREKQEEEETTEEADEEEATMYVTLYDLTYKVQFWETLLDRQLVTTNSLYERLAQMGTAIVPAESKETLSNVIEGMRENPVFEDYKLAFRENVEYAGYIFCSPNSGDANYEDVSIVMSVRVPEWNDYAMIHIEGIPDYEDRLEETGETFGDYPILADYAGELKYFLIGEGDTCIYIDGVPSDAGSFADSYSAKEAAYIFELLLTK